MAGQRNNDARCAFVGAACKGKVQTYEQKTVVWGGTPFTTHAVLCDHHYGTTNSSLLKAGKPALR